jgi:hypothetical protein
MDLAILSVGGRGQAITGTARAISVVVQPGEQARDAAEGGMITQPFTANPGLGIYEKVALSASIQIWSVELWEFQRSLKLEKHENH